MIESKSHFHRRHRHSSVASATVQPRTIRQNYLSPSQVVLGTEDKIYASDLGIKYLFVGNRDIGSYFENYIYLKLRHKKMLYYVYENTIEIDFFTNDKILIEAKFYSPLNDKQKELFLSYPAQKRIVIDSIDKLSVLEEI